MSTLGIRRKRSHSAWHSTNRAISVETLVCPMSMLLSVWLSVDSSRRFFLFNIIIEWWFGVRFCESRRQFRHCVRRSIVLDGLLALFVGFRAFTVVCQSAVAAQPKATMNGFLYGGLVWFAIPVHLTSLIPVSPVVSFSLGLQQRLGSLQTL